MKKKSLSVLLILILTVMSFYGCTVNDEVSTNGSEENNVDAGAEEVFVFIAKGTTDTLDPLSKGVLNKTVMHSIYDCLVKYGPDGDVVPSLAESWVEDENAITFKLREDVVFHDGSKLTADDVIFSFDTMSASKDFGWLPSYIGSWEKVDDYSVKINKPNPYSKMLNVLIEYSYVVSKEAYEKDPEGFGDNPVGTGAYKFVSKDVDNSVVLIANDDYFEGRPMITNVVIKPPIDASTRVMALETGEADFVMDVPLVQRSIIENNKDLILSETESWRASELRLLGSKFDDQNLRKAIKYAINKENVNILAADGVGKVSENLYSKRVMGSYEGIVGYESYNLEKAKEYLEKSEYNPDMKLTLSVDADHIEMAQAIQADLLNIGISVEIEQLDYNTFWDRYYGAEVEMVIMDSGSSMVSVEDMLAGILREPALSMFHSSEEKLSLIAELSESTDEETHRKMVINALEMEIEDTNIIPIFDVTVNVAHSNKVTNVSEGSIAVQVFYIGDFKLVE